MHATFNVSNLNPIVGGMDNEDEDPLNLRKNLFEGGNDGKLLAKGPITRYG